MKVKLFILCGGLLAAYGVLKLLGHQKSDSIDINADNPYISMIVSEREVCAADNHKNSQRIYVKIIKPLFDQVLSFMGLVLLSPIFLIISWIVYRNDPGPVIFKQKRVGRNGTYFYLHKFRTMKQDTPEIPTHLMEEPEKYLIKQGSILRKYSLDELPQLYDIFMGHMSIVGPRPALWNQQDLVEEREKYGANSVKPGLTGWAQINGRDELEIPHKAALDGEYARKRGFFFDCKCFFGTFVSVIRHEGFVEGASAEISGSREIKKENSKQ